MNAHQLDNRQSGVGCLRILATAVLTIAGYVPSEAVDCIVPSDVADSIGYVSYLAAPCGFRAATPWLNIVHGGPGGDASQVEIDSITLWARIEGVVTEVAKNDYDDGIVGGDLCDRIPWFGNCRLNQMPSQIHDGLLVVRPSDDASKVWHPFLNDYPRDERVAEADSVWMEARVRITGAALLQGGLDYYLSGEATGDPQEAGATDWYCAGGDWQIVRLEHGVSVTTPIRFEAGGGEYVIGASITATYELVNQDDDPVRFAELGIETRRLREPCCDAGDPRVDAFSWHRDIELQPGETRVWSVSWTPVEADRYCFRLVARPAGRSVYRVVQSDYERTIDVQVGTPVQKTTLGRIKGIFR